MKKKRHRRVVPDDDGPRITDRDLGEFRRQVADGLMVRGEATLADLVYGIRGDLPAPKFRLADLWCVLLELQVMGRAEFNWDEGTWRWCGVTGAPMSACGDGGQDDEKDNGDLWRDGLV